MAVFISISFPLEQNLGNIYIRLFLNIAQIHNCIFADVPIFCRDRVGQLAVIADTAALDNAKFTELGATC